MTVGWVAIDVECCKGCELCIPACPFDVLSMSDTRNSRGYRYPLLQDGCTGCKVCNEVCPDFVFTVYREPRPAGPQPDEPAVVDVHGLDVHGLDVHGLDAHGLDAHGLDAHGEENR